MQYVEGDVDNFSCRLLNQLLESNFAMTDASALFMAVATEPDVHPVLFRYLTISLSEQIAKGTLS
jgi:hypothetical protein